jgi:hypothetical protein
VQQNNSEVARLRQQINDEYTAAYCGLYGLTEGSARHEFINKRMQNIQVAYERIAGLVGTDEAIELVVNMIEAIQEQEGKKK